MNCQSWPEPCILVYFCLRFADVTGLPSIPSLQCSDLLTQEGSGWWTESSRPSSNMRRVRVSKDCGCGVPFRKAEVRLQRTPPFSKFMFELKTKDLSQVKKANFKWGCMRYHFTSKWCCTACTPKQTVFLRQIKWIYHDITVLWTM